MFVPLVDAEAHLAAAAASPTHLCWALPWLLRYLCFLPWDPAARGSTRMRRLQRRLLALQQLEHLRPRSAAFAHPLLCLRCVLDAYFQRCPAAQLGAEPDGDGHTWQQQLSCLRWDQLPEVDARYARLCCPGLELARQTLQVSSLVCACRRCDCLSVWCVLCVSSFGCCAAHSRSMLPDSAKWKAGCHAPFDSPLSGPSAHLLAQTAGPQQHEPCHTRL